MFLYSSPAYNPPPSLALFFVFEGDTNGWRYHDLQVVDDVESGWDTDLEGALKAAEAGRRQQDQSAESQNGEGDGVVADSEDFWSGFSDEEEEVTPIEPHASTSHLPPTSREVEIPSPNENEPTTPPYPHALVSPPTKRPSLPSSVHSASSSYSNDGDGGYWSQYNGVDDGLAPPSLPSTPGHDPNHHLTGGQEAWGTGGETPISWTPNPQDHSGGDAGGYFLPSDADDPEEDENEEGMGGGRPRGRTLTGDSDERGTYPTFPVPPFKGATPAGSPDIPRTMSMGGAFMQQQQRDAAAGVSTAQQHGSEDGSGSTPSPPAHQQSRLATTIPAPAPYTQPAPTSPPSKVVNGFSAVPSSGNGISPSSPKTSARKEVLKSALTSLLAMHRLAAAAGGEGSRAEEEWLEVAMEVGAEGLKMRKGGA